MKIQVRSAIAFASALMFTATPAQAITKWTGKIANFYGSGPGNYSFRVVLQGVTMTGCAYNFGYMNTIDGNYQAYVSLLLTDYSMQKTVDLYVNVDSGGFCHIVDIGVY